MAGTTQFDQWASRELGSLLSLDDVNAKQIVDYSKSLPPKAAADNLRNLLGDSQRAVEFITKFNQNRLQPANASPFLVDQIVDRQRNLKNERQPVAPLASCRKAPVGASQLKATVTGGRSMRAPASNKKGPGASSSLDDLDSAIRALELQTNPKQLAQDDPSSRRCNCMAQRHELLNAAPNCLNCGKIICVREGIGPCTFCGQPLIDANNLQSMIYVLRQQRGKERQAEHSNSMKRDKVMKTDYAHDQDIAQGNFPDSRELAKESALAHRDKLLRFQAQNNQRTTIRDEAGDFETPDRQLDIWSTPEERALQLKRQQNVLRDLEWRSRPEWEKRQMVVALDIDQHGRSHAVKKLVEGDKTGLEPQHDQKSSGADTTPQKHSDAYRGAFADNPFLGKLIRPMWSKIPSENAAIAAEPSPGDAVTGARWQRVQDDADNERIILESN